MIDLWKWLWCIAIGKKALGRFSIFAMFKATPYIGNGSFPSASFTPVEEHWSISLQSCWYLLLLMLKLIIFTMCILYLLYICSFVGVLSWKHYILWIEICERKISDLAFKLLFVCIDQGFTIRPGCSGTYSVDQASLKLTEFCLPLAPEHLLIEFFTIISYFPIHKVKFYNVRSVAITHRLLYS